MPRILVSILMSVFLIRLATTRLASLLVKNWFFGSWLPLKTFFDELLPCDKNRIYIVLTVAR